MKKSVFLYAFFLFVLSAAKWPNGPDEDPKLAPPSDPGFKDDWNLWSYVPEEWAKNPGFRQEEIAMGTGIHADRAWQVTTGDRKVIIAVLDSGIRWGEADLLNKFYLNRNELLNCKPEKLVDSKDDFDVNNDGIFNVKDYLAKDPSFGKTNDLNKNNVFDPEDLILKCSDGKDDDGNGYTDDISGWDTYRFDNNARDDTDYGHGTGEAKGSSGEGNNGISSLGVCPECTVLMVRVSDSFVADSNDFGAGVLFAVDSGASVIQEALGSVNNTILSQEAIDYAYRNNVVIIASAADEYSFHHNYPGSSNHTVYVHAIMYDADKAEHSTSFLNYNNCSNYGAQLLLSTSGTGCSSEATALTAGHSGLIYSAAYKAGLSLPLSAEEVRGILLMTSDDINIAESKTDKTKFPSGPGWDLHFGYGRNNVRKSVDAVMNNEIPPEADIADPYWFEIIYVDRTAEIDIFGRVGSRTDGLPARYQSYDYLLEYALSVEPKDNEGWVTIASGTTKGIDGKISSWNVLEASKSFDYKNQFKDYSNDSVYRVHQYGSTLRLKVSAKNSDNKEIKGEFRKHVFLYKDPDIFENFPVFTRASGESSPKFADLDGDGAEELVIATSDGLIHAFTSEGNELAGWPFKLNPRKDFDGAKSNNILKSCAFRQDKTGCAAKTGTVDPDDGLETIMATVAVGDVDHKGDLEVVALSWDGSAYLISHDGNLFAGFPAKTNPEYIKITDSNNKLDDGFMSSPVLYDMDKDNDLEIIAAAQDQHIYIWHHDGTMMEGWPVLVRDTIENKGDRIFTTPAVGDVDNDGIVDIVTGTNEVYGAAGVENEARGYLIHGDGNKHAGGAYHKNWPITLYSVDVYLLPIVGSGVPGNPALCDVDWDKTLEIYIDTIFDQPTIYKPDGTQFKSMNNQKFGEKSNSSDTPAYTLISNASFGRVDDKGGIDLVKGTTGFAVALTFVSGGKRIGFDHQISAWDTTTGKYLDAFPRIIDDWQFFMTPSIADINNDNHPEILTSSAGYLVHAFDYNGDEPENWPKFTGGWVISSPAVGDFDNDGYFDVATASRHGYVYVWKTTGKRNSMLEWQSFSHDQHNTGNYNVKIPIYGDYGTPVIPDSDVEDAALPDAMDAGSDTQAENVQDEGTVKKGGGGCMMGLNQGCNLIVLMTIILILIVRRYSSRLTALPQKK
jgi:hypothetical protein